MDCMMLPIIRECFSDIPLIHQSDLNLENISIVVLLNPAMLFFNLETI